MCAYARSVQKKELSAEAAISAVQLQGDWAERECFCILSVSQNHNDVPGVFVLSPSPTVARHCSRVLPSCPEVAFASDSVPQMFSTALIEVRHVPCALGEGFIVRWVQRSSLLLLVPYVGLV